MTNHPSRSKAPYRVLVLDADGCELSNMEEDTLRAAKKLARCRMEVEHEYMDSCAVKCEVRDAHDECVFDVFAVRS
jgi:hypothetical protein